MSKLLDFLDTKRPVYQISASQLAKSLIGSRYSLANYEGFPADLAQINSSSNPKLKAFLPVYPVVILCKHRMREGSVTYTPFLNFDLSRSINLSDIETMAIEKIAFDHFGLKEIRVELPLNL